MQSNTIRVIAAVVDTHNLTLYKEDGTTITIPQGDPRVRPIVDKAVPQLMSQGYADVSVATEEDTSYIQFEAMSNGVVKLFRIPKSKLAEFAEQEEAAASLPPISIGNIPEVKENKALAAVEDILQHAVSVNSPDFNKGDVAVQGDLVDKSGTTNQKPSNGDNEDTIIAVTNGKIIPGMELIQSQFGRAAKMGSTKGVEAFLARLASVIESRKHSVEDLLKFMERGDLPIADDGSILIYKVLRKSTEGKYVDYHTSKVQQWVGAYVCMDHSLVDHERNNECSNGLHVARRGYIRHFSGDVCVIAKLAPEDVIAVPSYDANKMRVCGYHIIAELPRELHALVKSNQPITNNPAGKVLLGKLLAGQHIGKTDEVRVTKHKGEEVLVTKLATVKEVAKVTKAPEAKALTNKSTSDTPLDPKVVVKQVAQLSRKEVAAKMYADGDIEALKAYKKAAKVSWDKLGVPDPDVTPPVIKSKGITAELVHAAAEAIEQFGEDELESFRDEQEAKANETKRVVNGVELGLGSPKERITKLLAIGLTSVGVAQAIVALKKRAKKSWETLGVSASQVEDILKLAM